MSEFGGLYPELQIDQNTIVAIDAMYVVNTIVLKSTWMESGDDLALEFLNRIDAVCKDAKTIAIAFDTYQETLLKNPTRVGWNEKEKRKKTARKFQINSSINIKKVTMSEILGTVATKNSLTWFLTEKSITHFEEWGITFAIAGNGSSYFSFQNSIPNNHEEADTMIINFLCILQPVEKDVVVHSVDTDVFTLLLRHFTEGFFVKLCLWY